MINILIVDDHPIVINGLKQLMSEEPEFCISGEAHSGAEALQQLETSSFDIILLDISLPDINGLDLLKQIKERWEDTKVLVLSMHPEEQYALRTIKSGASGYLTKNSLPDELLKAIRKVNEGGKYINPDFAEKVVLETAPIKGTDTRKLSDREFSIMCLLGSGKTSKEIAANLNLSIKTIDTYRRRIFQKLQFNNINELIRFCLDNELIQ
ncbi:MAG: response regulator transcription factor [Firmicutes bacterium]|nr:response regulator transcription factor [Bacillota bacterium]